MAEMPADIQAGPIVGRDSRGQRRSLCDHRRQREIRGEGNGRTDCGEHCRKRAAALCRCQKPGRHDLCFVDFHRLRRTLEAAAKRNLDFKRLPCWTETKIRLVFCRLMQKYEWLRHSGLKPFVMAGLVPAIHVFGVAWLLRRGSATSAGMTADSHPVNNRVSFRHGRMAVERQTQAACLIHSNYTRKTSTSAIQHSVMAGHKALRQWPGLSRPSTSLVLQRC